MVELTAAGHFCDPRVKDTTRITTMRKRAEVNASMRRGAPVIMLRGASCTIPVRDTIQKAVASCTITENVMMYTETSWDFLEAMKIPP
mmetsp:Transcript_25839/g.46757  ORF Transcript_25839/g.46757 Transcript_25839/m.46757 type:complete len:88 (-) Transcript_25839:569-832(-)